MPLPGLGCVSGTNRVCLTMIVPSGGGTVTNAPTVQAKKAGHREVQGRAEQAMEWGLQPGGATCASSAKLLWKWLRLRLRQEPRQGWREWAVAGGASRLG